MKILVILNSTHRQNTMKIAEAMAEAADMTITTVDKAAKYRLSDFDIVGFGSGIYYGKHSVKLLSFVKKLDSSEANAFVFSTSGTGNEKNNRPLENLLRGRNKTVLGSFCCKGHDQFAVFKLVGGLNKGRPDGRDLENARRFIMSVVNKCEKQV